MVQTFAAGGMDKNAHTDTEGRAISGGKDYQSIYASSTRQVYPIGHRRGFPDGRVFRYAKFFSAVDAGKLAAFDATSQQAIEMVATAMRTSTGAAAGAIASSDTVTSLYFLDTDVLTAAQSDEVLAGGFVHVLHSTDGGHTYRIKDNTYTASTSVMKCDLYDSVVGNIDSEAEIGITGSLYNNCAIANNGSDDAVAGISFVDNAAGSYGWLQTWGTGTVLADESAGTIAKATVAVLSDGVNGAAEPLNIAAQNSQDDTSLLNFAEPIIGYFLDAAQDKNFVPIYMQLAP